METGQYTTKALQVLAAIQRCLRQRHHIDLRLGNVGSTAALLKAAHDIKNDAELDVLLDALHTEMQLNPNELAAKCRTSTQQRGYRGRLIGND